MRLNDDETSYFKTTLEEFITSPYIHQMKGYTQHGHTSCLDHSLLVAYYSYYLARRLHLSTDYKSIIRGALLHDFFLYDWHEKGDRKGLHGFTHPKAALANAEKYFLLNDKEKDIILKHMWPLTIKPPRYKEAYIVSLADKCCSTMETLKKAPSSRSLNLQFY
ncbi:HD domain-containing protein [Cellulosilyticum sp. ST5]|uniref:HD domain-containing protein n=1 Tax=unclassified Cellulosilyticum TaxID=2643091 RepID=UPI000F8EC5A9|nr:HD domain-containing protein [Cellulosilyticum sp. WCF-2]QEH68775.1 HD domain-containing protein [Cellulosilyticum sp. WCF-2]